MQNGHPEKTVSARRVFLIIGGAIACGLVLWLIFRHGPAPTRTNCITNSGLETMSIRAGETVISAEIASSGDDKARGLSYRKCLNPKSGMLFTYELSGDYCYWMKDMNFAIDMLWLDGEKKVVTVEQDVSPDTYPDNFCPDRPAQFVLEVPSGFAQQAGWQSGTQFDW